jgi:hypothetical protein
MAHRIGTAVNGRVVVGSDEFGERIHIIHVFLVHVEKLSGVDIERDDAAVARHGPCADYGMDSVAYRSWYLLFPKSVFEALPNFSTPKEK